MQYSAALKSLAFAVSAHPAQTAAKCTAHKQDQTPVAAAVRWQSLAFRLVLLFRHHCSTLCGTVFQCILVLVISSLSSSIDYCYSCPAMPPPMLSAAVRFQPLTLPSFQNPVVQPLPLSSRSYRPGYVADGAAQWKSLMEP
jgi:hypothetical protein